MFAFPGIWRRYKGPTRKIGENVELDVYSFLTTTPNPLVATINHERMPVLLTKPEELDQWMNGTTAEAIELAREYPPELMRIVRGGFDKEDRAYFLRSRLWPCPAFETVFAFRRRSWDSARPTSSLSLTRPFSSRRIYRSSPLCGSISLPLALLLPVAHLRSFTGIFWPPIFSIAALAKNLERVKPRRLASSSMVLSVPASMEIFALTVRALSKRSGTITRLSVSGSK